MAEFEPPSKLKVDTYDAIRYRMNEVPPLSVEGGKSLLRSFTDNMAKIALSDPEVFLFTHKSAIPLADSVRAYYEELGAPIPELAIVNTKDTKGADEEEVRGTAAWSQRARSYHSGAAYTILNREVAKLSPVVAGARVAILDQFIYSHTTILGARMVAVEAGATSVAIPDSAQWYHDADKDDIMYDTISSRHAPFMRSVGVEAARRERRAA